MGNYLINIQVGNPNELHPRFCSDLYDIILSNLFIDEKKVTSNRITELVKKNNHMKSDFEAVGFFYRGKTYDGFSGTKSWSKRIPLNEKLYDEFKVIMEDYSIVKKTKNTIIIYLKKAFMLSKTLGDLFELIPQSFHAEIQGYIINYTPGSPVELKQDVIDDFIKENQNVLTEFKKYLMLRILLK